MQLSRTRARVLWRTARDCPGICSASVPQNASRTAWLCRASPVGCTTVEKVGPLQRWRDTAQSSRGPRHLLSTLGPAADTGDDAESQTLGHVFGGRVPEFVPGGVADLPADSDEAFWWSHAAQCSRPAAREMVSHLLPGNALGVDTSSRGISTASGSVFIFALGARHRHPRKIILFRQGDFYEALGFDAVMLVEHANLNPMSGHDLNPGVPKAGCPVVNLRPTLRNLVEAGYSVAVCEEQAEGFRVQKSRGRKTRYIAGIVTPASPHYAKGLADSDVDAELCVPHSPPTTAIVSTAVGYSLIQVDPELREVRVATGLTDDAVVSRIFATGIAPPLYVHDSVKSITTRTSSRASASTAAAGKAFVESLRQSLSLGRGGTAAFGSTTTQADTTLAFLQHICADLGLAPPRLHDKSALSEGSDVLLTDALDETGDEEGCSTWNLVHGALERDRLFPLHVSAASQLGLLPTSGIPRLVTYMLPRGGQHVPAPCTHWLERQLKVPPTFTDAKKISSVLHALRTLELAWPHTVPMSESRIAKLLREQETNHYFYREVREMLIRAAAALDVHPITGAKTTAPLAAQLALEVAASTGGVSGIAPDATAVAAVATHVADRIGAVVVCDGDAPPSTTSQDEWHNISFARPTTYTNLRPVDCDTISKLFTKLEKWRGRVRPDTTRHELQEVAAKAGALCAAIEADFGPILAENDVSAVKMAQLVCEWRDDALWLKGARVQKIGAAKGIEMTQPKDRWGRSASGFWSTKKVETALAEYKYAVHDAQTKVIGVLRNLATEISDPSHGQLHNVLLAAYFSLVFRSLAEHARASLESGWGLPILVDTPTTARLSYRGAWPYWIDKRNAVPNDIDVYGMTILTGPNMAGKSTVNRVVGSIALLANCGFAAPCISGEIAKLDNICVRMTSTDSPVDGKSGFAMEMVDVRALLRDATEHSLVLVDELGRGTEYRAGTALSAAVLEALVSRGCVGLFATHLHAILDLELATDGPIDRAAMGVAEVDGRLQATHKYEAGQSSRESLAFAVALDHGIPASVLARAQHVMHDLPSIPVHTDNAIVIQGPTINTPLEGGICKDVLPELRDIEAFVVDTLESRLPEALVRDRMPLVIDPTQAPPAVCAQRSMIYVLRSPLGHLYVGETDGLHERLATHRSKAMWKSADTFAISMPDGRSQARKAEAILIRAMHENNWPISNRQDGTHVHFGAANAPPL